jgi:hypothetical protein
MRAIRRAFVVAALAASGLVLAGCATRIPISSMEPAAVPLGAATHLDVLHGEGRRSARETVILGLIRQARVGGYFTVRDRSEDGFEVRLAGRKAHVRGGGRRGAPALADEHAGLRVDVVEWYAFRDVKEVTKADEDGKRYKTTVKTLTGNAVLAITLFDASGYAFLAEREYTGSYEDEKGDISKGEAIDLAAEAAVRQFLADITPRRVRSTVRLDDDDPGQEYIIQTAKAGNTAQAARDARGYLEQHPHNAAAAYNLAVFLDAMGEYEEALEAYDRALSLGNKGFYAPARAGCARRLAAAEGMTASAHGRR